jgi:Lipase maturation factor
MEGFTAPEYWLAREVLQRGIAAIYLIAFVAAARQFRALIGEHGMLPVPRFLAEQSFRLAPSIFHVHYSDRFFAVVCWLGAAVSAAIVAGVADLVPLWAAMLGWLLLWLLYLSIVNVGQRWYGFGWESLLLEAGFLAIFLGNDDTSPPLLVIWLARWLVFRVEFGAGLIKLRGDPCWRDLTCLFYHHETQPMPGPLSWFFHHLPKPLHRVEVAGNHFAQIVVPFALFAPQPVASVAGAIVIATQLWLVLSGNFAWLNWITIILAVSAIDQSSAAVVLPVPRPPALPGPPAWFAGAVIAFTVLVAFLSIWPVRNLISSHQRMNMTFNRFHLVNTYGAFGSIGRIRLEVVIEGTDEPELTEHTEWQEYEFKGKPGDPRRLPRQWAPYHLRLDWLMWFAAISPVYAHDWLGEFVVRLLRNDAATLRLLRTNPFGGSPPHYVRAQLYEYRFTTWRELLRERAWWHRTVIGEYLPPVALRKAQSVPKSATEPESGD